jgi:hypothetical protein
MSLNGYAWVEGNVVNDTVGELGFHNRYSYVGGDPVNRVDPTGLCEWPTNWLNPVDARCRFLADGLANRFGFPVENIIHLPYHELELLTALGSTADVSAYLGDRFRDAAIIPKLFIQDPLLTLQALNIFLCGGDNVALAGVMTLPQDPRLAALLVAGTLLAIAAVLAIDTALNPCPPCPEPNPKCHVDRVPPGHTHPPCPGDHWNEIYVNQNPITCQCFETRQVYLTPVNCLSQGALPPNPPCSTY